MIVGINVGALILCLVTAAIICKIRRKGEVLVVNFAYDIRQFVDNFTSFILYTAMVIDIGHYNNIIGF